MAVVLSEAVIEQIRAANDIVDVIQSCFPLKRAGANFVALCPFHREKTPSFNVNPQRQIFHCFGCHKGGDVFTFVQEYENVTFIEAARRLAARANIPLEFDDRPGQAQVRELKETLWQIHEQITQRWQAALRNEACGQVARDYLRQRGVSAEAIEVFRLGYAPDDFDDTVNWARSKGYDLKVMEQAGLVIHHSVRDSYYGRFRGRLMFPICDEQGRVIAFSGRVLKPDDKGGKYINSPETPIFHKSRVFFGLDKTKRAILEAGYALVCEGQLDLIACYMAGIRHVVAPQGTALTAEHARILKRYVSEVVLCFDSDSAGKDAAVRALDPLLAMDLSVRVAVVPAPHDPDSFIREHGSQAMSELIEHAPGFFDFYLDQLCEEQNLATDAGRLAVVRAMGQAVMKSANAVVIDTYARKTAQRLGVSAEAVHAEFRKTRPGPATDAIEVISPPAAEPPPEPAPPQWEIWLLKYLLHNDSLVEWVRQHLDLGWVSHAAVREALRLRFEAENRGGWHGVASLISATENPGVRRLLSEAAAQGLELKELEVKVREVLIRLRNEYIKRTLDQLTQRLNDPALDQAELVEIEQEKKRLRQLRGAPLEPIARPATV